MMKNGRWIWIACLLLTLLSSMRVIHLGADPPHDLSRSMGYMSDPGSYAFNARNKAVLGKWEMDMWNLMHISPLPHYLTYLSFRFFGTGTAQMNAVPAIFSILILIMTFSVFKKEETLAAAFTAVFLLGINFQFTMFSRIAVRVMPMLFFVLLTVFFAQTFLSRKNNAWMLAAGVSAFISFTVKATFFQILPAVFLGFCFFFYFRFASKIKRMLVPLGFFCLGFTVTGAVWLVSFYLPHRDMFQAYGGENIFWLTPNNFNEIIKNFWTRSLYCLNEAPVLFCLACLFIIILIHRAFTSPNKISLIEWISGLWLISNLIYYSMIFYHPARHLVALMVPIVFLAAGLLRDIRRIRIISRPAAPPWLFTLFLFGWMIFPLSTAMIFLKRPLTMAAIQRATIILILLDAVICGLIHTWLKAGKKTRHAQMFRQAPVLITAFLIMGTVWVNLKPYLHWVRQPYYRIQTISRDLGRTYEHMVLAGLIAPIISLENRFEAHPYRSGYINPYNDFIQKFGITHIFPTLHANAIEKAEYFREFPQALKRSRLIARYPLWQTYAELIALNPHPADLPPGSQVYEGETFFGEPAMPRFDEAASQKTALVMPKNRGDVLAVLPLDAFPAGDYQTRFIIKSEEPVPAETFVCKIDVVDRTRKKLLTYRNLNGSDFEYDQSYTGFELPLELNRKADISIRIYSSGKIPLWIDRVIIDNAADER
jgi:hypothetical protein